MSGRGRTPRHVFDGSPGSNGQYFAAEPRPHNEFNAKPPFLDSFPDALRPSFRPRYRLSE